MDMAGMKDMPGMETTKSAVTSGSPQVTAATIASTKTMFAPGSVETPHRDDVATSELSNDSSMASMSSMPNAFHFGAGDTLWAKPLTPATGQGYFGAILLLISMTLLLRSLVTARERTEKRWNSRTPRCCKGVEDANSFFKEDDSSDASSGHTWNAKLQFIRAAFTLATTTIGYLLMLAVMTLNLGYLLAILGGGVLGELTLGWLEH